MARHVIIDGNNLLHAMHAHAPVPHVGRETLVKIVERWAGQGTDDVTLVFDGATPKGGFAAQMSSSRIDVKFSAPETADDVIVRMVHQARRPHNIRVVSSDGAIRHEARMRKCTDTESAAFVAELFPAPIPDDNPQPVTPEKPQGLSPEETDKWMDVFGINDEQEPFDGHDAMTE